MPKGYWIVRVDVKDEEPVNDMSLVIIQSSRNSADAIWSARKSLRSLKAPRVLCMS